MVFASILEYACVSYIGRANGLFSKSVWKFSYDKVRKSQAFFKKRKKHKITNLTENEQIDMNCSNKKSDFPYHMNTSIKYIKKRKILPKHDFLSKTSHTVENSKRSFKKQLFVCFCYDSNSSYDDISIRPISSYSEIETNMSQQSKFPEFKSLDQNSIKPSIDSKFGQQMSQQSLRKKRGLLNYEEPCNCFERNAVKTFSTLRSSKFQSQDMKTRVIY